MTNFSDNARTLEQLSDERTGRRLVRAGLATVLGTAGLFGAWAAMAHLDSAVITYGIVAVDGNRQIVQHPDGGIVNAILVKEGESVAQGQELVRLDRLQTEAALQIQNSAVDSLSATLARLEAERTLLAALAFPAPLLQRQSEPAIADLIRTQSQIFETRRKAAADEIATLNQQIEQSRAQAQALTDQMTATEEQRRLIGDELDAMRDLFNKGLATKSRLLALERAASALVGQRQEYSGNIDRLKHNVAQLESQINETRSSQQVRVAQEADDARNRLEEAREKQKALRDVLDRTVIRAPANGYVLGLSVHTIGAVIGRGEKLLEIVPAGAAPIIEARASPADGARLAGGMKTELRVLSPEARNELPIAGEIRNRSADILTDARTAERYYSVEIAVSRDALVQAQSRPLIPGTPMEVIVPTHSRTVFAYMLDPILDSFRRGMREP